MDNEYHLYYYPKNYFGTIVDIGACQGQMTVPYLKRNPEALAVCYEPDPGNLAVLKENTKEYNTVIYQQALGNGELLYLNCRRMTTHFISDTGDLEIQTRPLSSIMETLFVGGKVALLIDVEGGEKSLIADEGAVEAIKKCAHVGIEIHCPNHSKTYAHFNSNYNQRQYCKWFLQNFYATHRVYFYNLCPASGLAVVILQEREE